LKLKAAFLIVFVSVVVYSNSLGGEFVYDDDYFVTKNVSIRDIKSAFSFFSDSGAVAFSELARDVYRPFTAFSYSINYFFSRLDVFYYHLTSVLLHSLCAALLFLFLYAVFGDLFVAVTASLLFACHPVQTEAVSWISGRSSVLSLFFYLIAFMSYVFYRKTSARRYLACSVVSYAVSVFSKEMAISLPLLLIVYDLHFSRGERLSKRALRYLPYILITAGFIIMRSIVIKRVSQCDWWGGSPYHNALSMMPVIGEYAKILIYPKNLCAFYVNKVYMSIAHTEVLISAGGLILMAIAMPFVFKRSRAVSFWISWFFITLLPVSNIVPIRALMAERFLYMPSIGYCVVLAILIRQLLRDRRLAIFVAGIIVLAYSMRTMARNEDWKDAITISRSIVRVSPVNPWAYASLGSAYAGKHRFEEAIKELKKSIALSVNYPAPKAILGFCYLEMGRYQDAVQMLLEAQKHEPDNVETMNSLGVSLANLKRYDEALRQFERAKKKDPKFITAYVNMGTTYEFMEEYKNALRQYNEALTKTGSKGDIALVYIRIGDLYVKTRQMDIANSYYRKAIETCDRTLGDLKKIAEERLHANWK